MRRNGGKKREICSSHRVFQNGMINRAATYRWPKSTAIYICHPSKWHISNFDFGGESRKALFTVEKKRMAARTYAEMPRNWSGFVRKLQVPFICGILSKKTSHFFKNSKNWWDAGAIGWRSDCHIDLKEALIPGLVAGFWENWPNQPWNWLVGGLLFAFSFHQNRSVGFLFW